MPIRITPGSSPVDALRQAAVGTAARLGVTGLTWQGPDDVAPWDLRPSLHPGVFLTSGWKGWGGMKPSTWVSTSPNVDGQTFRGLRFDARTVDLPFLMWHNGSSADMLDLWGRWWDSWDYSRPGTFTVSTPGSSRSLRLRLENPGDETEKDPLVWGHAPILIGAVADDPHWQGTPIGASFGIPPGSRTMFDTAGTGRVFNIVGGHTYDSAIVSNPGDLPARPSWKVRAPWTKVTVGVGSQVVTYSTPSANATDVLTITSDRGESVAYLDHGDGNLIDVTEALSSWGFASVPPGKDVPLTVQLDGTGTVEVSLTPRYFRPF